MSPFRWQQAHWLSNELLLNADDNIVIVMHMFLYDGKTASEFSRNIMNILEAHKLRSVISLEGKEYDFSRSKGQVACVLCGHCHKDFVINDYSIPVIGTTHFRSGNMPTYDIIVFDWERGIMNMIRVGSGDNRIINIVNR